EEVLKAEVHTAAELVPVLALQREVVQREHIYSARHEVGGAKPGVQKALGCELVMMRIQRVTRRNWHGDTSVRALPEQQPAKAPFVRYKMTDLEVEIAAVVPHAGHGFHERKAIARLQVGARNPQVQAFADKE